MTHKVTRSLEGDEQHAGFFFFFTTPCDPDKMNLINCIIKADKHVVFLLICTEAFLITIIRRTLIMQL